MKQFRELGYTYERLKLEVQNLKKESNKEVQRYNELVDKRKQAQKEYEEITRKLAETIHNNKVEISNYNKSFIDALDKKESELSQLEVDL